MNCGSPGCAFPKCGCRVVTDYRSIPASSRLYMEHWRSIWQAVINRDFGEEFAAIKRHAEALAKDAGTSAEEEAANIRKQVARDAQHAKRNLRRIEQAIGKR